MDTFDSFFALLLAAGLLMEEVKVIGEVKVILEVKDKWELPVVKLLPRRLEDGVASFLLFSKLEVKLDLVARDDDFWVSRLPVKLWPEDQRLLCGLKSEVNFSCTLGVFVIASG